MALTITVTEPALREATRRSATKEKLGWDSSQMDRVLAALKQYHQRKADAAHESEDRQILTGALFRWKMQKPSEFENRDTISGGMVRKLCVQCGLDDFRPAPSEAVLLKGEWRVNPQCRAEPRVTQLDQPLAAQLAEDVANHLDVALVAVDLYGDDYQEQGINERYRADAGTVGENIEALLAATRQGQGGASTDVPIYICCKDKTPLGHEIVGRFRNAIKSQDRQIVRSATNSAVTRTELVASLQLRNVSRVYVLGFDANMCVAATIFGTGGQGNNYQSGLLDYGFDVVTSRFVLASGPRPLRAQDGWPYMGPCNR